MDLNDGDRDDYRPTVIGKIVKWFIGSCVILVYAILMVRIFMSCEADLSETILLDEQAGACFDSQPSMFVVWQYEPADGVDEESGIWIRNVNYLSTASQLQCTVRVNTDRHPYTEGKQAFYYQLKVKTPVDETVDEGTEGYEISYMPSEDDPDVRVKVTKKVQTIQDMYFADEHRYQYGYNRLAFRGVELSEKSEAVLYIYEDAACKTVKRIVTVCGPDMIKQKKNTKSVSFMRVDGKD